MIPSQGAGAGGPQPAELLEQQVIQNPATGGWRLVFQVKPPDDDPVELRAFLRHGADAAHRDLVLHSRALTWKP